MTAILSINAIDVSLRKPGFWTQKRLLILTAIFEVLGEKKSITVVAQKAICRAVKNHYSAYGRLKTDLSVQELIEINEVISFLQVHDWNCRFLATSEKRERESVLPKNEKELAAYSIFKSLQGHLWTTIVIEHSDLSSNKWRNKLVLAAVLEIASSTSLSVPHLIDAFERLDQLESLPNNISVKVHPKASEETIINLPLSPRASLILNAIYHARQQQKDKKDRSLCIPTSKSELTNLLRPAALKLREKEESLFGTYGIKPIDILEAAKYQSVFSCIEPIIQSRLNSDILPLSPPAHSGAFKFLQADNHDAWPRCILRSGQAQNTKSSQDTKLIRSLRSQVIDADDIDRFHWLEVCRIEIRRAIQKLRYSLTDKRGKYRNSTVDPELCMALLNDIKPKCIAHFSALGSEDYSLKSDLEELEKITIHLEKEAITSIDLAIEWAKFRLVSEPITLDTFRKDISQLFNQGLFQYPTSYDLSIWDEEDAEILVSEYLLDRDLNDNTTNQIIGSMRHLCRFARENLGLFTDLEFPLEYEGNGLTLTRRNNILGLQEIDLVTSEILKSQSDDREQLACILDLAFYAGLRSGEIANLTLNNIVANRNEVVIYLPRFKTPSAYRSIPLHQIAQPEVCRRVQSVVEHRQIQHRKYKNKTGKKLQLKQVYLFAENDRVDECTSPEMICKARKILKSYCGNGADLHLLRHSFASHLFLRWYCCRYEDLIGELLEKDHWCFSNDGIGKLRFFVGENPDCPLPATNITSIIHLLKLMGHKTATTFFRVYVHSFEVGAQHALERSSLEDGEEQLSGKAIAALIPNCRSRTSQARIKDRSINGLAELVQNSG
ncbi:tyrosine-type recombinase/integrase [Amphritea sp. HPY]|uniref:tyrosine-type recombinase/integrase n=1 Tax=Amphritea sp. HPY TaxID=3421652 RepID=UPI003D7D471F